MFNSAYKRKRPAPISDFEESKTQQHFANDCNINKIMDKYNKTGVLDNLNPNKPLFGDFSEVVDYQAALNGVLQAQAAFADLPAKIRDKFGNDYTGLLEFVADEKNRDEAIALGLIEKPAEPVLAPEPVKTPEPAKTAQ